MKFGTTKGTEGLVKLTKFCVAALIFGDILPPTISWEATEIQQSATTTIRCQETPGWWCIGF